MKTHKVQTGISLIEIMIAMLIGVFLMGGLIQLFISSKQTYRMQDTISRLQENQRFAMDFLVHDMRGVSGWGCFRGTAKEPAVITSILNSTGAFTNSAAGILGDDNNSSIGDSIIDGTDSITLRTTSALQTNAGSNVFVTSSSGLNVNTSDSDNIINVGDILFVEDCIDGKGFIFQVTGFTGTNIAHAITAPTSSLPGNESSSIKQPHLNATLYRFNTVTYSIRTGESGRPALFQQNGNGNANELIEGVEDMQILYGEDTDADGTPNRYVPAGTAGIPNMDNVVSVQVSLLMQSLEDNQAAAPIPYSFNGAVVTPTDRRIRRSITSIISVRNRLQ